MNIEKLHLKHCCKIVENDETCSLRQRQAASQICGNTGSRFTSFIDDQLELDEYKSMIIDRVCDARCCK